MQWISTIENLEKMVTQNIMIFHTCKRIDKIFMIWIFCQFCKKRIDKIFMIWILCQFCKLTQFCGLAYSCTLKLHWSSGVVLRNKLFNPKKSNIANQFCLAYLAASSEWPTDLHEVFIAFKKSLVFDSSVSKLCSSIFSRFSVYNVDNLSPSGKPFTLDLHVITPLMYDIHLL